MEIVMLVVFIILVYVVLKTVADYRYNKLESEVLKNLGFSNWNIIANIDAYVAVKSRQTLEKYDVKATFFIPGEVARRYPDAVKMIFQKGHEIGCHGDQHEIMAHLSLDEQRNVLERATKELKKIFRRK